MNRADASRVLAKAAAFDNRKPSAAAAAAWAEALDDVPLQEALDLVSVYYATNREWIMPADINRLWKERRHTRLREARQLPPAPAGLESADYLAYQQELAGRVMLGESVQSAYLNTLANLGIAAPPDEITSPRHIDYNQIGR